MPTWKGKHFDKASLSTTELNGNGEIDYQKTALFQCEATVLGKLKFSKDESFDEIRAEEYVNKVYGKNRTKSVISCLKDGIRFEKTKLFGINSVRRIVQYIELRHIYIFQEKQDVCLLCSELPNTDKYLCQAIKCDNPGVLNDLCGIICSAVRDPEFYTQLNPNDRSTSCPMPFTHAKQRLKPIVNGINTSIPCGLNKVINGTLQTNGDNHVFLEQIKSTRAQYSPEKIDEKDSEEAESQEEDYKEKIIDESHKQNDIQGSPISHFPRLISTNGSDSRMFENEIEPEAEKDDWTSDITYFQYDPQRGIVLNDSGPIYMYSARFLHQH